MEKKKIEKFIVIIAVFLVLASLIILYINISSTKKPESASYTSILKLVIKQGEELTNTIKISNPYKNQQEFSIEVKNLDSLVKPSETHFSLLPNTEKNIDIKVSDKNLQTKPGIYTGLITITSDKTQEAIPIIIELQTPETIFAINLDVSPEHKELFPGSNTLTTIKFYNLNDTKTHNLEVTCSILDFSGNIIASERETLAVGTEATLSKTLSLPKNIKNGKYTFTVTAKFEDSLSTSSYLFSVDSQDKLSLLLDAKTFFIIIVLIIILFLFFILFLFVSFIKDRNKLFLELKSQQKAELKAYSLNIENQKAMFFSKLKNKQDKKIATKHFKTIKQRGIKNIKKKQEKQKREFKHLKKQKRDKELENKLRLWKKQGYDINPLLVKDATTQKKDLQNIIKKWKKQGYDISALTE